MKEDHEPARAREADHTIAPTGSRSPSDRRHGCNSHQVASLAVDQNARLRHLDPRVPALTLAQAMQALERSEREGRRLLCAPAEDGSVMATACVTVTVYPDDSDMLAFAPKRCGTAAMLTVPDPRTPAAVTTNGFADDLERAWRAAGADGAIVSWLLADTAIDRFWSERGFVRHSVLALRTDTAPAASAGPSSAAVSVRPVEQRDEERAVHLMVEQMAYHEGLTPFDRVVAGTVLHARARVRAACAPSEIDDDAFVLVAETDAGEVVGILECEVRDTRGAWSYLPPGRLGFVRIAAVDARQRGRGVGTALYRAACRAFAERSVDGLYTYFVPANPLASAFWTGKGFVPLMAVYQTRYGAT